MMVQRFASVPRRDTVSVWFCDQLGNADCAGHSCAIARDQLPKCGVIENSRCRPAGHEIFTKLTGGPPGAIRPWHRGPSAAANRAHSPGATDN